MGTDFLQFQQGYDDKPDENWQIYKQIAIKYYGAYGDAELSEMFEQNGEYKSD